MHLGLKSITTSLKWAGYSMSQARISISENPK